MIKMTGIKTDLPSASFIRRKISAIEKIIRALEIKASHLSATVQKTYFLEEGTRFISLLFIIAMQKTSSEKMLS